MKKLLFILFLFPLVFFACGSDNYESPKVDSIKIENLGMEVYIGGEHQLIVKHSPSELQAPKYIWTSLNPEIISVDENGKIKALKEGQATIKATASELNLSVTTIINVLPIEATAVKFLEHEKELTVGQTYVLNYTIEPNNTTNKEVTWKSSDESIVTVDNGTIAAISDGEAIITISRGNLKDECKIIVRPIRVTNVEFISRECRVNGFPVNSLIGAKECKRVDINHVRVSVRITTDNVFVLEHDDVINEEARNLDGSTITNDIKVSESTLAQLEQYDFGIKYGEQFKGMKIQKLADMIELCAGLGITLTIELKGTFTEDHATSICKMIAKYSIWDSVWVSDWVQTNLDAFIAAYPDINIAYVAHVNSNEITKAASFKTANNKVRIDIFDTDTMTEDLYHQAMKQNIAIKVGSVYKASDIPKWFELGVKYIEVANIPYPYKWLNNYIVNK